MHFNHSLFVSKQNKHYLQSVSAESNSLNCSRCVHHLCQENLRHTHVKTACAPCLHKSSVLSPWPSSFVVSEDGGDALTAVFPSLLTDNSSHDEKEVQLPNTCPFGEQTLAFQAVAERCQALRAPSSSPGMSTSVGETLLIAGRGAARWKNKDMP